MRVLLCMLGIAGCGLDHGVPVMHDAPIASEDAPGGEVVCREAVVHADYGWIQQHVFGPTCATAMCHAGAHPAADLSLEANDAIANLVDHSASTADGWVRVVPGSPSESYLMVALGQATGPKPRDGFMPLKAAPLCGETLQAVTRWVVEGAAP